VELAPYVGMPKQIAIMLWSLIAALFAFGAAADNRSLMGS
jgi:hypothetical protein